MTRTRPPSTAAARRAPGAYAIVGSRDGDGCPVLHVVTSNGRFHVAGAAVALVAHLASAKADASGQLAWRSVGSTLDAIGQAWHGRLNRRTLRTLVRTLRKRSGLSGLPNFIQSHPRKGLRLVASPVVVLAAGLGGTDR